MQSDGCNLCDIQGGSVNKTMPFSLATLMAGISKWDSWLSNINCFYLTRSFTCNKMFQMVNKETLTWPTHWVCTSNWSCRSTNQHLVLDTHPQKNQHWKNMVINGTYSNNHCHLTLSLHWSHIAHLLYHFSTDNFATWPTELSLSSKL